MFVIELREKTLKFIQFACIVFSWLTFEHLQSLLGVLKKFYYRRYADENSVVKFTLECGTGSAKISHFYNFLSLLFRLKFFH